jgi:hypothetical protein
MGTDTGAGADACSDIRQRVSAEAVTDRDRRDAADDDRQRRAGLSHPRNAEVCLPAFAALGLGDEQLSPGAVLPALSLPQSNSDSDVLLALFACQ